MKLDDFHLSALSADGRLWVATAIAGMICADGHVDDSEIQYLREIIQFLESKEHINEVISMVKRKERPILKSLKLEREQAFEILKLLTSLAATDTKLAQSEAKFLKYAGSKLGFDPAFSNRMMKWAVQRIQADKMEKELWEVAKVTVANYTDMLGTSC